MNSPVTASKPTCTVCSKFVGYEMLGLESLCDCFDLILLLRVFFLRSGSSGSVDGREWRLLLNGVSRREIDWKQFSVRFQLGFAGERTFGKWFQVGRAVQSIAAAAVASQPDRRRWWLVLLARHAAASVFCQ